MPSAFTNSAHVKTKIREALKYQLQQISSASGVYFNTVGTVFYNPPTRGAVTQYPSCVLLWGETPTESPDGADVDASDNLLHKLATLDMLWYLKDGNDAALAREEILADVESRIGNYPSLPDSGGTQRALFSWIESEEPLGFIYNEPCIGQRITIKIRYRQQRTDPTVLD